MKRGIKTMYVHSEMVASGEWVKTDEDDIDRLNLVLKAKGGGCHWEFGVRLEELGGRLTMRLNMWDDSWEAFAEAPEVFQILRKYNDDRNLRDVSKDWPMLIKDLEEAGWKHVKPKKVKVPKVAERCGKCGR